MSYNYSEVYEKSDKELLLVLEKGYTGLSDILKFFMKVFSYMIPNNIKVSLLIINPLYKFFDFKYKPINFNIIKKNIKDYKHCKKFNNINNILKNFTINNKLFINFKECKYLRSNLCEFWKLNLNLLDLIDFKNELYNQSKLYIPIQINYIAIHLRLGDKYLEKSIIPGTHNDKRNYDINKLYEVIENNKDKIIYFFCDNNTFKKNLKEQYDYINILNLDIGHTGSLNCTDEICKTSIIDFILMMRAEEIHAISKSGFSSVSNKISKNKYFKYFE